jgi:putative two-component system response regulator
MVKNVIIVDDESDIRYTIKHGLETVEPEYKVICVENGKKLFELLKNKQIPDVILLDLMMPEMNGWEIQKKLKESHEWRQIPVVFITAVGDSTSKRIGHMTASDFIEKPVKIPELKLRLDKILKPK